jgi:hypothetical protein
MNAQDSRRYVRPLLATLWLCAGATTAVFAAAPARPATAAPPSKTQPMSYGAGTLSLAKGSYQFAPQGCVHNGNRAICNFYVTYTGALAGNVNAWAGYYAQWTMNVQLIDNLHVPHGPDTAYFIDATGAHQPVLFIQQGTQVWVAVEFPNVDASVTNGEFHMGKQIVGGVVIAQPNLQGAPASTPQYAATGTPAPAVSPQPQPAPAAATSNCVAGTPGYSGAALCGAQDKMNVAKGWKDLLSGFAPARPNPPPQVQSQPPQMQPPQAQMQPPQMQPPQMQPPQAQMQPPQPPHQ